MHIYFYLFIYGFSKKICYKRMKSYIYAHLGIVSLRTGVIDFWGITCRCQWNSKIHGKTFFWCKWFNFFVYGKYAEKLMMLEIMQWSTYLILEIQNIIKFVNDKYQEVEVHTLKRWMHGWHDTIEMYHKERIKTALLPNISF